MVDSSRRRSSRRSLMSNHNRCWIWGRNVVLETLHAGRWPILELIVSDRIPEALRTRTLRSADKRGISVTITSDDDLSKVCRSDEHQGFAARMSPFPCCTLSELMQAAPANGVIALLDRLQDPFNLGAVIRSASTLGVDGIVLGDKEQSEVNSQVARSSAGAVNHVPIAKTADLVEAIQQCHGRGFQIIAASEKADQRLDEVDFRRPTVIVIGNEGRGIRAEILALSDRQVSIPMTGPVGSLNAAVAAGILFYEMRRQRSGQK